MLDMIPNMLLIRHRCCLIIYQIWQEKRLQCQSLYIYFHYSSSNNHKESMFKFVTKNWLWISFLTDNLFLISLWLFLLSFLSHLAHLYHFLHTVSFIPHHFAFHPYFEVKSTSLCPLSSSLPHQSFPILGSSVKICFCYRLGNRVQKSS